MSISAEDSPSTTVVATKDQSNGSLQLSLDAHAKDDSKPSKAPPPAKKLKPIKKSTPRKRKPEAAASVTGVSLKPGNWSQVDDDQIWVMKHERGLTYAAIASQLHNRTPNAIKNRLCVLKGLRYEWTYELEAELEKVVGLEGKLAKSGGVHGMLADFVVRESGGLLSGVGKTIIIAKLKSMVKEGRVIPGIE